MLFPLHLCTWTGLFRARKQTGVHIHKESGPRNRNCVRPVGRRTLHKLRATHQLCAQPQTLRWWLAFGRAACAYAFVRIRFLSRQTISCNFDYTASLIGCLAADGHSSRVVNCAPLPPAPPSKGGVRQFIERELREQALHKRPLSAK